MSNHTMRLKVKELDAEDAWKDIVRIRKRHRKDNEGADVDRGTVCCLTVGTNSKWVVVHGAETHDAVILMDRNVRDSLDVESEIEYDFTLKKLPWLKKLWFPWRASDPIYRLPAQLGLIALVLGTVLGLIGILIGLIPIWKHW